MAADYSKEDIKRLEKITSELSGIVDRQKEIIDTIIAGEIKIGKTRMAQLDQFFDAYEDKLQRVVAKKTSQLSEEFITLENLAAEQFAAMTKKHKEDIKKAKKETEESQTSSSSEGTNVYSTISDDKRSGMSTPENTGDSKGDSEAKKKLDKIAGFVTRLSTEEQDNRLAEYNKETVIANEDGSETTITGEILARRNKEREINHEKYLEKATDIENKIMDLYIQRNQTQEELEDRVTEVRLARINETLDAEIEAAKFLNEQKAKYGDRSAEDYEEAGVFRSRKVNAEEERKSAQELEDKLAKYRENLERKSRLKNGGELKKEEAERIEQLLNQKYNKEIKNLDKYTKERLKKEVEVEAAANRRELDSLVNAPLTKENNLLKRFDELKKFTKDEDDKTDPRKALAAAVAVLSDLIQQLNGLVDEIGSKKGVIDTRLQGSNNKTYLGSYWDQIVKDMTAVGAINPYFKQQDFANNIAELVKMGISFDVEQRAFLMTIKDKIATTFNVADGTLLRLIRIQQEDTTAGRLGMESALNAFLNNMYETTEYLNSIATSVRNSLQEMESLMESTAATEVEFQVQKWLGSLYSVGMSDAAVGAISSAFGQIAAGQIEGLTNGGAGNLLIMAANDAGIPITDILTRGLDAKETNSLLQASVNYLAELAESAKDNNVVQQQLANVFGVKASDLRAATNLSSSTGDVFSSSLTYGDMITRLNDMAGSLASRTSVSEIMTNIWNNVQYSLAGSMASNPITYMLFKGASLLEQTTGGIAIPALSYMGTGVDLETTVADLMRVAAMSGGIITSFGSLISGLGNSFSGKAMLEQLGIGEGSGVTTLIRGNADGANFGGSEGGGAKTTSTSAYVGNSSGNDIKNSTLQEAEDQKKQLMVEAKEEAEANQIDMINETVLKIYELLDDVTTGKSSFRVKVEGYGLTGAGSSSSSQAGVAALANAGGGGGSSAFSSGSDSSSNSSSVSGNASLSGWATI